MDTLATEIELPSPPLLLSPPPSLSPSSRLLPPTHSKQGSVVHHPAGCSRSGALRSGDRSSQPQQHRLRGLPTDPWADPIPAEHVLRPAQGHHHPRLDGTLHEDRVQVAAEEGALELLGDRHADIQSPNFARYVCTKQGCAKKYNNSWCCSSNSACM